MSVETSNILRLNSALRAGTESSPTTTALREKLPTGAGSSPETQGTFMALSIALNTARKSNPTASMESLAEKAVPAAAAARGALETHLKDIVAVGPEVRVNGQKVGLVVGETIKSHIENGK